MRRAVAQRLEQTPGAGLDARVSLENARARRLEELGRDRIEGGALEVVLELDPLGPGKRLDPGGLLTKPKSPTGPVQRTWKNAPPSARRPGDVGPDAHRRVIGVREGDAGGQQALLDASCSRARPRLEGPPRRAYHVSRQRWTGPTSGSPAKARATSRSKVAESIGPTAAAQSRSRPTCARWKASSSPRPMRSAVAQLARRTKGSCRSEDELGEHARRRRPRGRRPRPRGGRSGARGRARRSPAGSGGSARAPRPRPAPRRGRRAASGTRARARRRSRAPRARRRAPRGARGTLGPRGSSGRRTCSASASTSERPSSSSGSRTRPPSKHRRPSIEASSGRSPATARGIQGGEGASVADGGGTDAASLPTQAAEPRAKSRAIRRALPIVLASAP